MAGILTASSDGRVDLPLGLLVNREVPLVDSADVITLQILVIHSGRRIERQLAEHLIGKLRVLLLENPGVVAQRVVTCVIAVLRHLVDEEQRQHLDALREELALLIEMGADHLADLDAALGLLGHVPVGELAGHDDVAVAQLDHVTVGIDVSDEQPLVRLDPAGHVVQVRASVEPLYLTHDRAALGLHLQLHTRPRTRALGDLDRVEVQVRRRPGEALHGDAPYSDLLHQLLVVGVQSVESMHLGVLDAVGRRVAKHHQRVEP